MLSSVWWCHCCETVFLWCQFLVAAWHPVNVSLRLVSQRIVYLQNPNLILWCDLIYKCPITTKFCTSTNSSAVGECAKFVVLWCLFWGYKKKIVKVEVEFGDLLEDLILPTCPCHSCLENSMDIWPCLLLSRLFHTHHGSTPIRSHVHTQSYLGCETDYAEI